MKRRAGSKNQQTLAQRADLKLSLRGGVERASSTWVGLAERRWEPDQKGADRPLRPIFLKGILLGFSVSSLFMSIEVLVNPFEDLYKK